MEYICTIKNSFEVPQIKLMKALGEIVKNST